MSNKPEVYTEDEVARIIRSISPKPTMGTRNRALIMVFYRSGIRCAEALALRPCDLDREKGTIRVLHGKGDKARTVAMDDSAFEYVDRWLEVRDRIGIRGPAPLFCTRKGTPVPTSYVRKLLPRLGRKAGIEKRIHAHGFRHTMASQMRAEREDLLIISSQLGHSNISTTDRYLNHLEPESLIKAMKKRKVNRSLFFEEIKPLKKKKKKKQR